MKRILQIIPTLDNGGAEKQLCLLAAGLPRNEFETHVCVLTRTGPREADLRNADVPVSFINKSWKIDPGAYWRLKREITRLQPDLVHTWIFAANSYGRPAALRAGVPRIVAGERCVDRWKAGYEFAIDRHLAKRTDRIATNSSGVVDFYTQHGLPGEKFVVIPNGIEQRPPAEPVSREALLAELDLPADARLIGAVGRLWPQKRYKDLIWASELLRVVRDDTFTLIIGDGPQHWRLQRYVDQVGSHGRVFFLGQRNDVARLLPHFDVFCLTSGYEGQSNALMEAMLAGVPAVASDIPGNRDLVVPEETGFLVPLGDRALLARRINQLLNEPETAARMGEVSRRRMLEHFTVGRMVERHAELYRELIDGQTPG
ncbi:MAG: glycosyltransferase [Planctomycetales bacterium]|nr:glycosyltransferase [Planctomycetales bacterium]MCA9227695.1 glycosyltransferase [Planctomycetales bacterium]